jgi:hypothetical protein
MTLTIDLVDHGVIDILRDMERQSHTVKASCRKFRRAGPQII